MKETELSFHEKSKIIGEEWRRQNVEKTEVLKARLTLLSNFKLFRIIFRKKPKLLRLLVGNCSAVKTVQSW